MSAPRTPAHAQDAHPPRLAAHRQLLITSELNSVGAVRTCDLIHRWGVSYSSLSRDLDKLAARGLCQRVHGGAVATRLSGDSAAAKRTPAA